ncbi:hypothetical protein [Caenimonas aquaedulcis]|uniref:Uncharacterized protein n=1 Tax=Caenimonas aquaedulcis TaxID=2793270 RepID=A0A931H8P9_9BURK|nr:hypothetical protein [Caenimonas aquaedulcis]MBG9390390.1 hypothetical protein [Caenimonas aquaedulcis]
MSTPGSTQSSDQQSERPAAPAGKTPNTDMQPEDTGTASSGETGDASQARSAMKQTSKTASEAGDEDTGKRSNR